LPHEPVSGFATITDSVD
jgi:alcohol dehydrogenase class IV